MTVTAQEADLLSLALSVDKLSEALMKLTEIVADLTSMTDSSLKEINRARATTDTRLEQIEGHIWPEED